MDALRFVLRLAGKDLRLYFRDKMGMALGFLLPIVLITVFAAVFGSLGGDGDALPKQTLRIADQDGSAASKKLIETLRTSDLAEAITEKDGKPYTRDELVEAVTKGRAPIAVVIEKGFESKIDSGETKVAIEVIRDPAKGIEYQLASQALLMGLMKSAGPKIGRTMTLKGVRAWAGTDFAAAADRAKLDAAAGTLADVLGRLTDQIDEAASRPASSPAAKDEGFSGFGGPASMLGIRETLVTAPGQDAKERERVGRLAQSIAGTAVMMLLFGLTACGTTILAEREGGTLRRLLVSPAPRAAILGGKFLFTLVIGLLQVAIMFAFGALVFRLPVLDKLPGVVIVSLATCAAATSFGIFIATVGRSQKQIEGLSVLVILVMSAIGGSWFPLFLAPKWMQVAGHFTLSAWAMDGYMGVLAFDWSWSEILVPVAVLFGVAAVLSILSVIFFRARFAASDKA